MKKARTIILMLAAAFLAASCSKDLSPDSEFVSSSDIQLKVKSDVICTYEPLTWQLSYDQNSNEFTMGTDDMSDWCTVKCSDTPSKEGQKTDATVTWSVGGKEDSVKGEFEVVKVQDDTYWLWCGKKSKQVAVTVCVLR